MYSDPDGVAVWSCEEYHDVFSVGTVIVVLRGWRSSSLPTATNLLPFGQRKYLVAAVSRVVYPNMCIRFCVALIMHSVALTLDPSTIYICLCKYECQDNHCEHIRQGKYVIL